MGFRPPPTPTEERARQTEELIREQGTDTARWAQTESLASQWDARAAMAAEWIPAGAKILDVGCGAMALEKLLKPGCTYIPADVVERRPGCQLVDLNKKEFPAGQFDWVTFLGVLEYVHDIDWPLARSREAAPRLLATYCTYTGGDTAIRRGMGWVNDLPQADFEAALTRNGWHLDRLQEVKRGPTNIQVMFACSRTA
jgi:hypothetical protein